MKIKFLIISLWSCLLAYPVFGQADNNSLKTTAASTFDQLDADGRYAEDMTSSDLNVLPFGIRKTISNNEFAIAISQVKSNGDYVELTAFARMKIGQRKEPIYFAATGLKFSAEAGFLGDASLVLIGDIDIPINENLKIILRGGTFNPNGSVDKGNGTSMSVDCSGFKELVVSATLVLSQSLVTRVSASGQPTGEAVSADFSLTINDWNNMIVALSLPDFQIKGLDGFIFSLSNVVFDFSDFANSNNIPASYLSGYLNKHFPGCPPELWRGVYAGQVSMTLPKDLSNGGAQTSISAQNFLIDENGITGTIEGDNILPIESGNASGWAFSIDKFWISLETNKVTSGGFAGLIGLPVSENGTLLGYNAQIMGNNNYNLTVAVKDSMEFDMLLAQAKIDANSWVKLSMENGKFLPEANLSGTMTINTPITDSNGSNSSDENTTLNDIKFTNLHLMTFSPYISVDYMGYSGEVSLLGLPVSISDIAVSANNGRLNLGFGINLNLDDKFLNASTHLNISSEYGTNNNRGSWKYTGTTLDEIGINGEIDNVLTLTGHLKIMDNNPSYGSGFYGDIILSFNSMLSGAKITAAGAFGNKDGQRYWFVDGSAGFPAPIPVVGVLGINGFGGGLSMGMRRTFGGGLGSDISKTGCGFVPEPNAGLGLKAAVMFVTTSGSLVSGDASFEMIFNKYGGINTIGFYGYVALTASIPGLGDIPGNVSSLLKNYVDKENTLVQGSLAKIEELEKTKNDNPSEAAKETTDAVSKAANANIAAAVGILYTPPTQTLHATFDFYVNAAGGLMRGVGSDNRAGSGELHISPSNWHIYMGTPDNRCGLKVGIPGIATVETTAYFMLGDNIPGSPAPPKKVTDLLSSKGESYDYMRDLNLLSSGTGIAFGTSLDFSTGDLTCLMLYARFDAEAGFDIMLKDYLNVQCKDRSGPIGMDGWYANGQAYFYLGGELGVKVNLKFIKGKFPVIKGGAAALLQAKLPNPTWFGGAMGVNFNVLGGLVKGSAKFKFSFGDECELVVPGTSPLDISMISDLTPMPNATNVDVFAAPQLALTYPANEAFQFSEDGETKEYRINVSKFVVKDGDQVLPGEIKWNSENTLATFYSHDVLPPNKQLKLEVAIGFEENKSGNWSVVTSSGEASAETRDLTFTTGDAPDYVPMENIEYAYPLVNQKYYYPGETRSGYVQLKRGQSYLFPNNWKYGVTAAASDGSRTLNTAFSYDAEGKRLVYTLPGDLTRQKSYKIDFTSVSNSKSSAPQAATKETVLLNDEDNSVVQTSTAAGNIVQEGGQKSVLNYEFSSSKYSKFTDKMAQVSKNQILTLSEGPYIIGLGFSIATMDEYFEEAEIFGTPESGNKPLIQATAILEGNIFYEDYIYTLIYKDYSLIGIRLDRDGDEIGIPPVHAFGKYMAEENRFPIRYETPRYYFYDFGELQRKYVNAGRNELASSQYPDIISGEYPTLLEYVLPGGEKGSNKEIKYEIYKK